MDHKAQDHIRNLIQEKWRRLRILEMKEAKMGLSCPPEIITEMEDLRQEIADLEEQRIPTGLTSPPPPQSQGPLGNRSFADHKIKGVVNTLRRKHLELKSDYLPTDVLFPLLDILFDRKSFRFEALGDCTEQRWSARLHAAYQVAEILEAYQINVRATGTLEQAKLYSQLLQNMNKYCMEMGVHLFETVVAYVDVKTHIGQEDFETLPLKAIEFARHADKKPKLPEVILQACDVPRQRAVELMDKLYATVQ